MNTEEILNQIFKDPEVKHGLKLFDASDFASLVFSESEGTIRIQCAVTQKFKVAKPEEVIRQLVIHQLTNRLSYPIKRLSVEVPIVMGSGVHPKKADIVVYADDAKLTPRIIVEVKKPNRKDGLEQLNSYMNATGVYYGAWINGNDSVIQLRSHPNFFETIKRLPGLNETIDDVKTPIKKSELVPIEDLKDEIQYLEDTVLANAGVNAFEEIFKLIFAKLFDESDKGDEDPVEFRTTTASPAEQYKRLNKLFKRAIDHWPGVFSEHDNIEITPQALIAVASAFQTRSFFDTDLDVIDAAFEYLINPEQKGDKGQYFTPRAVVDMCVQMLNPKPDENVLDPACGPAGFLIHSLDWVYGRYIKSKYSKELAKRKYDYAARRLFGIDFDPRLTRVAKAMMIMSGDGRTNVYRVNSLDPREWEDRGDDLLKAIPDGKFHGVMTNPPFAGSITQPEILGGYDLAYKGDPAKNKRAARMTRDILFIERCLRFLRPGGRLAIVLPQGNVNNSNAEYLRTYLLERARLLAVVGLHPNTFRPFTSTKTSVVFVQKRHPGEQVSNNEKVFLAVNEHPVKDTRGNYVYKRDAHGYYARGVDDKRIVAHDLDEIAHAFIDWAKAENLDFWEAA